MIRHPKLWIKHPKLVEHFELQFRAAMTQKHKLCISFSMARYINTKSDKDANYTILTVESNTRTINSYQFTNMDAEVAADLLHEGAWIEGVKVQWLAALCRRAGLLDHLSCFPVRCTENRSVPCH